MTSDRMALDDLVRVLGTELGKSDERVLIGSTEAEKKVLKKYSDLGTQRVVMGGVGGALLTAGAWKALGGQKRLLGAMTVMTGAVSGAMYGGLSIRRGLFVDILTLPDDQSPFAQRSRRILDERIPSNAFYLEIKEMMKKQEAANGTWNSAQAFPTDAKPVADNGGYDFQAPKSQLPPLPKLPTEEAVPFGSEESTATDSTSPFFFNQASSSPSKQDVPPLSQDYYGRGAAPARQENNDDGYFSWEEEDRSQDEQKPTTWEEIRRRAGNK
ncbi:hypothetical protein Poli38472_010472 [Pythium oligandrum]|uniref:Uncharacterized protein n=1 Tax=Pythium oligandrum TaxID=41045 RepID=A0A8K1F9U3_PYTOL|nr:hypothetical protein Poli38472_010472 [Pythium oligandrum]|eukprot:TMW55590.1 hypothetical protein Poli38472_010472 [Pythium oligandrum]